MASYLGIGTGPRPSSKHSRDVTPSQYGLYMVLFFVMILWSWWIFGDNAGSDPNGINSYGSYGTGRGGFHLGSPAKVCKTAEELRFGSWVYEGTTGISKRQKYIFGMYPFDTVPLSEMIVMDYPAVKNHSRSVPGLYEWREEYGEPLPVCNGITGFANQVKEVLHACQKQDMTSSQYEYEGASGCRLPEWNGLKFMNSIRNRKIAFVGDSILVNMFASLECLLGTQGFITRVERGRVGKLDDEANTLNGELTGEGVFITLFSSLYNAEISLLRSNFLVDSRASESESEKRRVIDTTRMSPSLLHALASADILVLSSGPWWHEGNVAVELEGIEAHTGAMSLYSKSMDYVATEILLKFPEKRTIWTDVLPYHGECNKYSAPSNHTVIGHPNFNTAFQLKRWSLMNAQINECVNKSTLFDRLPLSDIVAQRPDAHIGSTLKQLVAEGENAESVSPSPSPSSSSSSSSSPSPPSSDPEEDKLFVDCWTYWYLIKHSVERGERGV